MLKLVICDDENIQLNITKKLVDEWITKNNLDAITYIYNHPDKLLLEQDNTKFHIYILDIVMPMINGIELGTQIRRMDSDAQIIFTTSAAEYALDSFAANPTDYIVKPIDKNKLFNSLDLCLSKIDGTDDKTFAVKTSDGLRIIPYNMIICCERTGKTVTFLLTTGEEVESLSIRESFSEYLISLLKDKRFLQPHVSFVINMAKVEKLDKKGFTLRLDKFVPVSAKQYTDVRNYYLDFRLKGD